MLSVRQLRLGCVMHWKVYPILISTFLLLLPSSTKSQSDSHLDDKTLSQLSILTYLKSYQIEPGQSHTFTLLKRVEGFPPWEEAKAQVTWSVEPQKGVHIDPVTGEFRVDKSTPAGSIFEVKAAVENGCRILSAKVYVFTPETHPLVNLWKEKAEVACGSQEALSPANPIRELIFWADGTFSVTWKPFETYRDYWGTYTYSKEKGKIRFKVEAGNNIPANIDGEGYLTLKKNGDLVLKSIWLGSMEEEAKPNVCRMIFVKSDDN
jgi:hypothetical protein